MRTHPHLAQTDPAVQKTIVTGKGILVHIAVAGTSSTPEFKEARPSSGPWNIHLRQDRTL
jgi:hypothetical protein